MDFMLFTLTIISNNTHVLLGMKNRGFGVGKWNGFGGKVHSNETCQNAAIREVREECGLDIKRLEKVGYIEFEFDGTPPIHKVHVFKTNNYSGTVQETQEMKPKWFLHKDIPYDDMWVDDKYWLPQVLLGQKVEASFKFKGHEEMLSKDINFVKDLLMNN